MIPAGYLQPTKLSFVIINCKKKPSEQNAQEIDFFEFCSGTRVITLNEDFKVKICAWSFSLFGFFDIHPG